jgi:hypothetical protein
MTVHITLFIPDGRPIDFKGAEIESQLLPDLTFTAEVDGKKKRICSSLPYLIEREIDSDV